MSRPAGTIDSRLELWSVALFLLAFWSFNVLTATAYPFEHLDEGMFATPAIRNPIREGKNHQIPSFMQSSGAEGMLSFDQHLADRVRNHLLTFEQALEICHSAEEFTRLAGRL